MGSIVGSEVTAAAIGLKAGVRRDPFAMLPFCGYNMGDYFKHWIDMGDNAPDKSKLPKIFNVNWFRKDENGKWLWPGYGDNIRVLEWIFNACDNNVELVDTPIGYIPDKKEINIAGIEDVGENLDELLSVDNKKWLDECELIEAHFAEFGSSLPKELKEEFIALKNRLK
jgi:phosphoenolpyruvate carboxykinase (GTP)